jgi:hypothetical protein
LCIRCGNIAIEERGHGSREIGWDCVENAYLDFGQVFRLGNGIVSSGGSSISPRRVYVHALVAIQSPADASSKGKAKHGEIREESTMYTAYFECKRILQ